MNIRVFAERGIVRHLCDGLRHFRSDLRARFTCAYEGRCNGTCRNGWTVSGDDLTSDEEQTLGLTVPVAAGTILVIDRLQDCEYGVYDDCVRVPRSYAERGHVLADGQSEVISQFDWSVVGVVRLANRIGFDIVITNRGGRAVATYEEAPDEFAGDPEPDESPLDYAEERAAELDCFLPFGRK